MGGRGLRRGRIPRLFAFAGVAFPALTFAGLSFPAPSHARPVAPAAPAPDPRRAPAEPSVRGPALAEVGDEILSEGFEDAGFPPAGWTYAPVAPAPHRWLHTTEPVHVYAGSGAAIVRWSDGAAPDEWLRAPPLDLTAVSAPIALSFWYRTDPFWFTQGSNAFAANVSTDNGQSWQPLFSIHDLTVTGWAWRNAVADLSGFVGLAGVQIRFRYWGLGAADVALDDIRIGASGGGVPANDTCAGAAGGGFRVGPAVGTVVLSGDNRLAAHDYPLSAGGCAGWASTGRDLVWIVEVPAAHRFQATMDTAGDWDDLLFLVSDCADPEGTCVSGDRGFPDGATVSWANDTGVTRELRLIAAGFGGAEGEFTISATIEPGVAVESRGWGRVKAGWRTGSSR